MVTGQPLRSRLMADSRLRTDKEGEKGSASMKAEAQGWARVKRTTGRSICNELRQHRHPQEV